MELKDVILSTLAEIEEIAVPQEPVIHSMAAKTIEESPIVLEHVETTEEEIVQHPISVRDDEARMLEGIRERLLVLFEGFQSPNNVQIEAKVDLTLNFLEYLLATIDNRLETIKK